MHQQIFVADQTLTFRPIPIDHDNPTGAQIAAAAGFNAADNASVLHFLANGDLEDLRPTETIDLVGKPRFVIVPTDRTFRFTLDGTRFDWPARIVSGAVIRKLGHLSDERALYLQRVGEPDRQISHDDLVDLGASTRVEAFVTRERVWKLNVQGVILELSAPTIRVRDALTQAGFDPDRGWYIFLKVVGHPKKAVGLDDEVDLRTPGIEKLRLTPKEVNNGEAVPAPRRAFRLLELDERHLDSLRLLWETVEEGSRRWLLIHDYPVPDGYTVRYTLLALEIPPTYPAAEIDMFYVRPALALRTARNIPNADVDTVILGATFKRWSRHRGAHSQWNASIDNVVTHLALVESALAREVGE